MKRLHPLRSAFLASFLAIPCLGFTGCDVKVELGNLGGVSVVGNGEVETEKREVEPFDTIVVHGSTHVQVDVGGEPSLEVTADSNVLPVITTTVKNGTLTISSKDSYNTSKTIVVKIATPTMKKYRGSGATAGEIATVEGESLEVDLEGASSLECRAGKVEQLSVHISGASRYVGNEVEAKKVKVIADGASSAKVQATETLDASANGASSVRYAGSPKDVKTNANIASSINKL